LVCGARFFGFEGVFSPELDREGGAAGVDHQFAGSGGEDVSAGDDAGALELEGVLYTRDGVEAVAGEGEVDGVVALGLVVGVGGDEDGGVAAAHHAVVKEEAERGGGRGWRVVLLFVNDSPDGVGEFGAGFLVVVGSELGLHGGEE